MFQFKNDALYGKGSRVDSDQKQLSESFKIAMSNISQIETSVYDSSKIENWINIILISGVVAGIFIAMRRPSLSL